ncbi:hypothetical protein CONLIGDRAFT_640494 [Coniochaeta ligniaria NRRL 30616]|uniref:Uncharacterized protein n=1 Tax=Coniochaeta ligniaria NRRL 30616 TaxID=1408157 RepID=A0A1J7J0S3_9PEZI|nr:hypothetical protein CONLIGDRAFT_640494 [Coniochaeta ligniaria NRRL 30616]
MERVASRPGASSDSAGLPWTATRCHRLLRPLLTHISALRKEVNRHRQTESLKDAAHQDHGDDITFGGRSSADDFIPGTHLKRLPLSRDPVKLLSQKRVQHTYSLKASKRQKIREGPAEHIESSRSSTKRYAMPAEPNMYLATPIVRRVQGQWSSPLLPEPILPEVEIAAKPGRCYHSHEACAKKCFFEDRLATLRKATMPSTFALYESIYRALDALLRATSAAEAQPARPKSLLAMCLRKVPDYLAELEAWRLQELEESGTSSAFEDSNTSFDVYSDLESLGTGNCGWKHLATVVQSHGIRIVKDAILERLVADDFAILLAELCSKVQALDDRRQLLEAVVTQQHRRPCGPVDNLSPDAWSRASPVLELLLPPRDRRDRTLFRARLTTDLLSSQLLPQEWISSKTFSNIWSVAMRYFTGRTADYDAIPFFIASIQLYCNQIEHGGRKVLPNEGSAATAQQLLINSLATLSTLVLLGQETLASGSSSKWRHQTATLCKRAEYVLRACLADASESYPKGSRRCSTYVLLLAVFLLSEAPSASGSGESNTREEQMLTEFWTTVEHSSKPHAHRQYTEATVALIASIARGCTRKDSARPAAHTYLIKLCDKLDAACPRVKALRRIRVDAAFYLADLTGDLWDLSFAEQLAATSQSDEDATRRTPGKNTAVFSGFRWDEGISEWVTVTPEIARRKQPSHGRATRARRCASPGILATMREAEIPQESPISSASEHVSEVDFEDVSDLRTPAELGTSCHAKRPRRLGEAQPTHGKPGVHTTKKPGQRARESPEMDNGVSVIDGLGDGDLDELRFAQADQENRPPSRKAAKVDVSLRRKRSRRSLVSLRPTRNVSNDYYDESSGDELGM